MTFLIRQKARFLNRGYIPVFYCLLFLFSVNILFLEGTLPALSIFLPDVYVGINLILRVVFYVAATFLFLFSVFSFRSGADRFFLRKAQGQGAKVGDFFYYLSPKRVVELFRFYLNFYIRKLILVLLCFTPFVISDVTLYLLVRNGDFSLNVTILLSLMNLLFLLNGMFFYYRFSVFLLISRFCFAGGKYLSQKHLFSVALHESEDIRKKLFKMRLSFSGWFLSCLLILPIGFVWGYFKQSVAAVIKPYITG
ncbi:MAG: hypothetical protein ACI4GC_07090 [Acutalibacteraceae bacterium]